MPQISKFDYAASPLLGIRIWNEFLRWLRVLWVCRASVVSATFGMLLFAYVSPARDLFMETGDFWPYWSAFFAMVLIWSLLVHYTSRKCLDQQAWAKPGRQLPLTDDDRLDLVERYRIAAAWIPRLLGLVCLGAVLLGITGAQQDLVAVQKALDLPDPRRLLGPLAAVTIIYLLYVLLRQRIVSATTRELSWSEYLVDFVSGRSSGLLSEASPFWFVDLSTASGRRARPGGAGATWDIVAVFALFGPIVLWLAAVVVPWLVEVVAPRALFVIVMLGLPLSLVAFLSTLSHYWRMPLIAGSLLLFSLAFGLAPTFHDLRQIDGQTASRIPLTEAVDRWVRLNCGLPPDVEAKTCGARPIILASAGGASRAAFFTASVVGGILDDGQVDLHRRLFAISGVSGGSVGAAVIRAAFDDADAGGGAPCKRVSHSWFRYAEHLKPPFTWRACLQALTAGDFLSRPFIGLAFRDLFAFPLHPLLGMSDRATLLETAFEDQYKALVDPDGRAESGLARAVGAVPQASDRWSPLLVLNTTSALDGRRSIISDLLTVLCRNGVTEPLFPAAVDAFETMGAPHRCNGDMPVPSEAKGVRLSSGATASARFPLISPPAGIRNARGEAVDLVVDGGYFENDGLTSARQLAEAIHILRPDLPKPVILHVTNNPTSESTGSRDVAERSRRDASWHDAYTAPLTALVATRDGHAAEAIAAAQRSPGVERVLTFQVFRAMPVNDGDRPCSLSHAEDNGGHENTPRIKDLSMSWWLSGAVQRYLDSQPCHRENADDYMELVRLAGSR